jgi:hypothetical protein
MRILVRIDVLNGARPNIRNVDVFEKGGLGGTFLIGHVDVGLNLLRFRWKK